MAAAEELSPFNGSRDRRPSPPFRHIEESRIRRCAEGAAVQRLRGLPSLLRVGEGLLLGARISRQARTSRPRSSQLQRRRSSSSPSSSASRCTAGAFGFFILSQSGERGALAGRLALTAPMSRSARVLARSAAQSATSHVARPCDPQTLQVAGRAEPRQTCGSPPPTSTMWIEESCESIGSLPFAIRVRVQASTPSEMTKLPRNELNCSRMLPS
jgi:hypothetical protein